MRWVAFISCALAIAGCGDDDSMTVADTGPGEVDSGTDSGPPDTGPPPMSEFLQGCVTDEQCPGPGGFCRLGVDGYPGGQCSRTCVDRGDCDDGVLFHHCIPDPDDPGRGNTCVARCLNSPDCLREGYVCLEVDGLADGVCVGYCDEDADCGAGAECNVHSARCVPEGTVRTEGADVGEACADNEACLSDACVPPANGFPNGYCIGNCVLPAGYNSNTFYFEDALPTEQCPGGNVCFPSGGLSRGEAGVCLQVCTEDADCRDAEGYECRHTFEAARDTKTFTNGVCFPRE